MKTLQSRGYDVETYVIGLVNGQEKLTITESILLRYTTAAVAAQCRQWRGNGGALAAASHWCSGGCFVPIERPLEPRKAVGRSENPGWGGPVLCGGHNLLPLVVIGLTGLPNSGWAKAHPGHPLAAALLYVIVFEKKVSFR